MSDHSPVAEWLEFHDLDVSGVLWEGTTLHVEFRFGTVYDAVHSQYGYRTGVVTFTDARYSGSFPDTEEETWLWSGEIKTEAETFPMIPLRGLSYPAENIETRVINADGGSVEIHSQSVSVSLTGVYQAGKASIQRPAWNKLPP